MNEDMFHTFLIIDQQKVTHLTTQDLARLNNILEFSPYL